MRLKFFLLCGLFLVTLPFSGFAKDLSHRLGVGFSNPFSIGIPSLTARYYPSAGMGFSVSLGVDTEESDSKFGLMAKYYSVIFEEENLNFYVGAGAGLLSQERPNDNDSGFQLSGLIGVEFFFQGLENLGFTFETGVSVTSIADSVRFQTLGQHPIVGGISFYF